MKLRSEYAVEKKPRRPYLIDAILTIIVIGVMYWIFPDFVQNFLFDVVLRNAILVVPWIPLVYVGWRFFRGKFRSQRRIITGMVTLLVVCIVWDAGVYFARDYFLYLKFGEYTKRDDLVEVAPQSVRFTPLQNACADLGNTISTSSEHVECNNVQPILMKDGRFGYVAPITPSGFMQTFLMKNPGFQVLDDSAGAHDDPKKRIHRITDVQKIGQDMEFFDNLDRTLVLVDFFAHYEKPHYLALDSGNPDKLTAVVTKIKYAYFFQLSYWAGVVLVHSDGSIEDLSKEEALADPRLSGQWLYPLLLEKKYVDIQDYATGYGMLSPVVRVPGKLEIEALPGSNQFPFLVQGTDGNPYLVTATKGEGSAKGLFRIYFRNAYTGKGSYHEFEPDEVVYGASASLSRVTNIPGYNWQRREGDTSSGNMVAVEPVYLTRPGEKVPYWKFTVTNREYAGISATIVAHGSRPDDMMVFKHRAEFEAWQNGGGSKGVLATDAPTVQTTETRDDQIKEILKRIEADAVRVRELLEVK